MAIEADSESRSRENVSALVVEDLVIRGMSSGLANRGGAISLERVSMEHNLNGVLISTGSVIASDCRFVDIQGRAFPVLGNTESVRIFDSEFIRVEIGIQVNPAIYAEVVDCTFVDGGAGVASDGATINVERITMTNVRQAFYVGRSIGVLNVTEARVHDVDFAAFYCIDGARATVLSSKFTDTVGPAIVLQAGGVMQMNDSDLIPRPGEDFIRVSSYPDEPVTVFNFENNYWGTTDRREIADPDQGWERPTAESFDHNQCSGRLRALPTPSGLEREPIVRRGSRVDSGRATSRSVGSALGVWRLHAMRGVLGSAAGRQRGRSTPAVRTYCSLRRLRCKTPSSRSTA